MHIIKTVIYSKLKNLGPSALLTGLAMGTAMVGGTYIANRFIMKIDKIEFEKCVAALLFAVGLFMMISGE